MTEKFDIFAAALAEMEPLEAMVKLLEMQGCLLSFAGILPGTPVFEQTLIGMRDILIANTANASQGMNPYRPTRH